MKNFRKFTLPLLTLLACICTAQVGNGHSYAKLTALFDAYPENDGRAMTFVNLYIAKAKKEKKVSKVIAGYEEAQYFSKSADTKIKYADSAVAVALKSKDKNLIADACLKRGIIYYYCKRNYRQALQEYLAAFKNAENTEDLYLYHKILYHIGMVKSYLGFYRDAAGHFRQTAAYYGMQVSSDDHPNVKSNHLHGYINSIYRLSNCYGALRLYRKEDSLITVGKKVVTDSEEFALEFAYFQQAQGIQSLRNKKTDAALVYLKSAESRLSMKQDFVALATVYFYLGKLNYTVGNKNEALRYLEKADAVIDQYNFVTPEIIDSYKFLIRYARQDGDGHRQLFYTDKLLRADSIIRTDFPALSGGIHNGFDVGVLLQDRDKVVRNHTYGSITLSVVIVGGILAFYLFLLRARKKEKFLTTKYADLLDKFKKIDEGREDSVEYDRTVRSIYSDQMIEEVKKGLKIFEEKKQFLKSDLRLPDVAALIRSNRSVLSFVLNEHLKTTFSQYLKILRIQYITKKLLEDRMYLKYSMDTLAAECGMKNRQVFSNHFLEMNGMRPTDFVRKRQEELENS